MAKILTSPLLVLAAALAAVCLLLVLPLSLPIGAIYWDGYAYYDAANRIYSGQVPSIDFFTPVGPLGYYLFAGWLAIFPNGHPTLLAHWSLLAITAPLMAVVLSDVQARSRGIALWLLLPFLLYALLPFNTREFYPVTGTDNFGIYNRQVCQMIYVLLAALMFMRDRRRLIMVVTATITALFFLKITGFVVGVLIAAYGLMAGRISLRAALASAAAFLAILGLIEVPTGIVSAYIADIVRLLQLNSGTMLPRLLFSASYTFGVSATTGLLALFLLWVKRAALKERAIGLWRRFTFQGAASFLDEKALWLLVAVVANILVETQSTGSQALIFAWPIVLAILLDLRAYFGRPPVMIAIAALASASVVPPAVILMERAARVYLGGLINRPLESRHLKTLGHVTVDAEVTRRAGLMLDFYPEYRAFYEEMAAKGEMPTHVFSAELDIQVVYLIAIDRAIDAILAMESAKGIRFETITSLNFVSPVPWLMDRTATKLTSITADANRTMPEIGPNEEAAMRSTDLVLYPTCPQTAAQLQLYEIYKPALAAHTRIKLDACYDAFINPKFAAVIAN